MATISYTIIAGANTAPRHIAVNIDQPLYGVIEALVRELRLPTHGSDGAPIVYGLFVDQGGNRQRLGRDVRLAQTPYAPGTTLYLAPAYAPWWEAPVPVTPAPIPGPRIAPHTHRRALSVPLLALAIVGVGILALVFLLWFFPREQNLAIHPAQAPASIRVQSPAAQVYTQIQAPTATLTPPPATRIVVVPTSTLIAFTPTFTPAPTRTSAPRTSLPQPTRSQVRQPDSVPEAQPTQEVQNVPTPTTAELFMPYFNGNYVDLVEILVRDYGVARNNIQTIKHKGKNKDYQWHQVISTNPAPGQVIYPGIHISIEFYEKDSDRDKCNSGTEQCN